MQGEETSFPRSRTLNRAKLENKAKLTKIRYWTSPGKKEGDRPEWALRGTKGGVYRK